MLQFGTGLDRFPTGYPALCHRKCLISKKCCSDLSLTQSPEIRHGMSYLSQNSSFPLKESTIIRLISLKLSHFGKVGQTIISGVPWVSGARGKK